MRNASKVFGFPVGWPISVLVAVVWLVGAAKADVRVASPFGDHMVLQCEAPLPVWGTAAPHEAVSVEFAGQRKQGIARDDGRWRIELDPIAASAEPRVLTVKGSSMAHPIRFADVLVGEVWVCGGQSNMERQLGLREGQQPITNWEQEVAAATHPTIRQLYIKQRTSASPQLQAEAAWTVCSPETVSDFTAVGYFFARDLQAKIGVPIGIIHSSRGGSPAEAWTSAEGLSDFPEFAEVLAAVAAAAKDPHAGNPTTSTLVQNISTPSVLYNAMIAPLIPYAIRGVAFYQGEANAERGQQYRKLFPALIADWRKHWGQGDFPFLFVQIAPHREMRPELREAQLLTWRKTKNTAMVVTLDCGDIEDIHPPRKQPVGARLALAARAIAYKEDVEYSGPVYERMTVNEDRAVLHFSHLGGGLAANDFTLMGFTMAGPDGHFHAAHGEIVENTVEVSIPDVEKPMAVRYAWERAPDGNLVNDLGLPASPFRTDYE
ncbi:MAG TPA: sialate O-acetylesterase [Opitutus sp.]|nr:sialate O-acetylesterase [Opitutus sp.]